MDYNVVLMEDAEEDLDQFFITSVFYAVSS